MFFLRKDFAILGGYDQVGRAMRELVQDQKLMKLGYGLYAKARMNQFTGKEILMALGGFNQVAKEALKRLNVDFKLSDAESAYQSGSTQIPAIMQVMVLDRFSRAIKTEKFNLKILSA